jgi:DNA-binding MarR family transcriptional regulator
MRDMKPVIAADECNCLALRQAARYVTQLYERHLAPVGITAPQFSIVAKLSRRPGQTMQELADAMVMDRTSLVRALKPLLRDAWVVSGAASHNARAHVLRLTEHGEAKFREAYQAWCAAQTEFEREFGEPRAQALRRELFSVTAL